MKFVSMLVLAGVANAEDFSDCGEITVTTYTDSDCSTKKDGDAEVKMTPPAGCTALLGSGIKVSCNTSGMKTETWASSDTCSGDATASVTAEWGKCEAVGDGTYSMGKGAKAMASAAMAAVVALAASQF